MRLEYTVDAETGGMLSLTNAANKAERGVVKSFNKMDAAVSKLSAAFTAVSAAISANQIVKYAESWAVVNNKLANSVRENEKLADVTERVLAISQDSRSSLDSTASLYSRLERATRSAGTSTSDLIKLTETINKAFIVSGATTAEAESAVIQLSQGLASGTLRGEEFNSVNEQGNRLIVALSESLGVTSGKLRELAFDGKLTTDVVVKGLLQQGDKIAAEFTKTMQTFGQATTIATNNLTEWVGSSTTVKTIVGEMGDGVVSLSKNLETVAQVAAFAGLAFGSKLVGGLTLSTQASVASAVASQKQAQASAASAAMALRRVTAEKQSALALVSTAKMEELALRGKVGHAFALENLTRVQGLAFAATGKYNVALAANATAQTAASATARTMTVATTGLKTAMTFLGGPVGVIMLAASALYIFGNSAKDASKDSELLTRNLDKLGDKALSLTAIELERSLADAYKEEKRIINEIKQVTAGFGAGSDQVIYQNALLEKQREIIDGIINKQDDLIAARAEFDSPSKPKGSTTDDNSPLLPPADSESLSKVIAALATEREAIQAEYEKRNAVILAETVKGSEQQNDLLRRNSAERATLLANLAKNEAKMAIKASKDEFKNAVEIGSFGGDLFKSAGIARDKTQDLSQLGEDPLDEINRVENERLALIAQYQAQNLINIQAYEDAKTAIQREATDSRNNIIESEKASQMNAVNSILGATSSGFDALAGIMEAAQGKQSSAYQAMFAMSKAFQLGQAGLNLWGAIMSAYNAPDSLTTSQKIGNAATIAGAAGGVMSSLQGVTMGGGRLYGGATQAGKAYRVNENGRPEMFTNKSGQQFMMSGAGNVTPASDLGGSTININQSFVFDGGTPQDQQTMQQFAQMSKAQTMQIIQQEMRQGGMLSR